MRVECKGSTAAWLAGTLGGAKYAGTRTASATGVMAFSDYFFKPLIYDNQKASWASFSP